MQWPPLWFSLASKFKVEGGEADSERLEQRAGVRHVHIKVLLPHAPKLQVDVVVVVLVYQLKVLDARLVHTSIEIQHERLHL